MVYGTPVILMYVAMLLMSSGISSALVVPPLVIGQRWARASSQDLLLAIAFLYAGNAVGAPIWGLLGTSGNTKLGLYLAPVLLALFVLTSLVAAKRGNAQYRLLAQAETPPPVAKSQSATA